MIERSDITLGPVRMTRQKFLQNPDRQINVAGEIRAVGRNKNGAIRHGVTPYHWRFR
jgi:hypothetical protein